MKEKQAVRANRITGQQKRNNITRYEKRVTHQSRKWVRMIGCDPSGDVPRVVRLAAWGSRTDKVSGYQRLQRERSAYDSWVIISAPGGGVGGRPTAARGIGGTTPNTKHPTRDRNPFSARQLRQNNRYYIHHKSRHQQPRSGRNLFCFHFPSAPNFGPRNIFNKMMEFSAFLLRFSLRRLSALFWLVETRSRLRKFNFAAKNHLCWR